jgi:cell division protein FtsN
LSFDSKVENQTVFEEFEKAKKLSQLSFKKIELANEVLSFQDKNTEVLMPYYKQLVIEDLAENTETKTSVETYVPEKEVIADSQENVEEEVIQVIEKLDEIAQELETYDFYYRIQFAAYNEMVGEENFPTLLPLFTERIENSRLIRFMTGTYFQLATAQQNLPRVRDTGFEDAFIVAYFNGKRITIAEARRLEQELQVQKQEELLVSKDETATTATTNVEIETVETPAEPEPVVAETRTTINTELVQTTDVFYCIQVGVYRERINPERLYNLAPLFYDEYRHGLVRHVFGKYYDLNIALQEQNRIRQLGITDAFVTAYANGKQIYLYEARNLLANENLENKQEITLSEEHVAQAQVQAQERPEIQREPREPEQQEVAKIEYYIQLGAFRNEPNNIVRDMFLKLAGNKKLYKTTNNNLHTYRVGSFDKYNEALTQLNNIKNLGLNDAFIVAFNNGKRINLATARQLE